MDQPPQSKNAVRNRAIKVTVLVALAVFYFIFDPLSTRFMPQCVFHRMTGWDCAGCGSQRMLHALLRGNLRDAWEANALALLAIPFIGFLFWVDSQRTRRPELYRKVYSKWLIIISGIVIVGWFLLRNLLK